METKAQSRVDLPVLPLRDVVVYPHMTLSGSVISGDISPVKGDNPNIPAMNLINLSDYCAYLRFWLDHHDQSQPCSPLLLNKNK